MNKIYLFGKIISKSKLKYIIEPKLKLYLELIIQTVSGNIFKCIVNEEFLDVSINIKEKDYVYIRGCGCIENNLLNVIITQLYKLNWQFSRILLKYVTWDDKIFIAKVKLKFY